MFQTHDRSPTLQVNITKLIDDVQCYQTVRDLRCPDGITCPACQPTQVIKRGFDDTESARQRYECTDCRKRFDDLTDTIPTVRLDVISLVVSTCGYNRQLVASFGNHSNPLKSWEKTEPRTVRASAAHGPENMAITRISVSYAGSESHAFF